MKKYLLFIFAVFFAFTFSVSAAVENQSGEGGGGGSTSGSGDGSIKSSSTGPYGYRIYLVDQNGNKISGTTTVNLVNNWDMFTTTHYKNKTYQLTKSLSKKEFYANGENFSLKKLEVSGTKITVNNNIYMKSPYTFNNCYSTTGNFWSVISNKLHLKEIDGNLIIVKSMSKDTEATNAQKKEILNDFFNEVKVSYTYEKMLSYLQANKNNEIYIKAEFIGAYYNDSKAFFGTAPELAFYAKNVLKSYNQNAILTNFFRCAYQNKNGGGYYKVSLPASNSKWISWDDSRMKAYMDISKDGNSRYSGMSIYSIKLDEVLKSNDCSALSPDERCGSDWYNKTYKDADGTTKNCCDCSTAKKTEVVDKVSSNKATTAQKNLYEKINDWVIDKENKELPNCSKVTNSCEGLTADERCSSSWYKKTYKDANGNTKNCCDCTTAKKTSVVKKVASGINLSTTETNLYNKINELIKTKESKELPTCNPVTTETSCKGKSAAVRCSSEYYNKYYTNDSGDQVACCDCSAAKSTDVVAKVQNNTASEDQRDFYKKLNTWIADLEGKELPTCDNKCEYELDREIATNCSETNQSHIEDKVTWACAFKSEKAEDEKVKIQYKYDNFSNDYCSFYCKDEITYELPTKGTEVNAGRYYILGCYSSGNVNGPISFTRTTHCRSTGAESPNSGVIDYNLFKDDYKDADDTVLEKWDAWQITIIKKELYDAISSDTRVYKNSFDEDVNVKLENCSNRNSTACKDEIDVEKAKDNYNKAIGNRDNLITQINNCNRFVKTDNDFAPELEYHYSESLYNPTMKLVVDTTSVTGSAKVATSGTAKDENYTFSKEYLFDADTMEDSADKGYFTHSEDKVATSTIKYHNCGTSSTKSKCTSESNATYDSNPWVESYVQKTLTYKLPENRYYYINKKTGESTDAKPADNYEYVGFSNLPIHFTTKLGDHPFDVKVTSFGPNDKFNKLIIEGTNNQSFNGKNYYTSTEYACTYNVKLGVITNGPTSGNSDQDPDPLIYRSISLNYPFLTISGDIRNPGYNWDGSSFGTDLVDTYIAKNREVETSDVYNLDPMYKLTLTPALIRTIREYNKKKNEESVYWFTKSNGNAVEGVEGYSDFDLTCETSGDSKSEKCVSSKIREWGVKGCAVKDSGSFSNCSNTEAW